MKNRFIKRVHVFFSSALIFFLHLPFVFATINYEVGFDNSNNMQLQPVGTVKAEKISSAAIISVSATKNIYDSLNLGALGLRKEVFECAMRGYDNLRLTGKLEKDEVISIADLSKSSCKKRLYILDLKHYKLLFNTYVAHGMNSGQEFAKQFSNTPESNKTSLGFYETSSTYNGKNGYSLHLVGMERGINDNAYRRDIVMHGAGYVNEDFIRAKGYIGRSQGCPAVPEKQHKKIIDKIKNGTCLFIYGEDMNYLRRSALLKNTMPPLAVR